MEEGEDPELEVQTERVSIDAAALHLVTPAKAMQIFDSAIGSGTDRSS